MTGHAVKIERRGVATAEVVATDLTADRAHTLAEAVRRTLAVGERLFVEHPDGFSVIAAR